MNLDNPYRPPAATDDPVFEAPPATERARRPITVWTLVTVLGVLSLAIVAGTLTLLWRVAPHLSSPLLLVAPLAFQAVKLAFCVTTLVGLWRRQRWARWLGLAVAGLLAVLCTIGNDQATYPNEAQRAGAELAQYVLLPTLSAWWGWTLAFSAKGRRYFGLQPVKALQQLPVEPR